MATENTDQVSFAQAFGERVRQLRRDAGMTQGEMAEKYGFENQRTVSRIESAAMQSLSFENLGRLRAFAEDCGKNPVWLLVGDIVLGSATKEELVGALGQKFAEEMAAGSSPPKTPWQVTRKLRKGFRVVGPESLGQDWQGKYVPIIGRVAAGVGFDTEEAESGPPGWAHAYVEYSGAPDGAVAVRVIGDSMTPEYSSGDIVIVDTSITVRSGICCVLTEDEGGERTARLKMLSVRGGSAKLKSLNPDFPDDSVPAGSIAAAYPIHDHLLAIVEEDG